jgi:hypothetical protein
MTTPDTNYTRDDDPPGDPLLNPERGFYCNTVPDAKQGHYHTLMPAYLYLDEECDTELVWDSVTPENSSEVLKKFAKEKLDPARAAGAKVVFRPRYDTEGPNKPSKCGLFHAKTIQRQKDHIDAVAKMIASYKDVIAFIQAGYLGKWGEWNTEDEPETTAPFLFNDANRAEIIDHVLKTYKEHQIEQDVGLRRPVFAREVVLRAEANGEPRPNVGIHNDCFMASNSDGGTYSDFENIDANFHDVQKAKDCARELAQDASFGGETCKPSGSERWRDCNQVLAESAEMHLTYLNGDFFQGALDLWREKGCFETIRRRIGYRFEVKRVEYTQNVAPGGSFTVVIDIENSGWAKLHKPRTAEVVLRADGIPPERYTPSNSTTAEWAPAPGTTTTRLELTDTAPITPGTYSVRLAIPDPDARERIAYAVKLASKRNGVRLFDANTGENDLGVTIEVQ